MSWRLKQRDPSEFVDLTQGQFVGEKTIALEPIRSENSNGNHQTHKNANIALYNEYWSQHVRYIVLNKYFLKKR